MAKISPVTYQDKPKKRCTRLILKIEVHHFKSLRIDQSRKNISGHKYLIPKHVMTRPEASVTVIKLENTLEILLIYKKHTKNKL